MTLSVCVFVLLALTVAHRSGLWECLPYRHKIGRQVTRPDDSATTYHAERALRHGWRAADIDIGY